MAGWGARERRGVGGRGGFNGGDGSKEDRGDGLPCARRWRGKRDGLPHSCSGGERENGGEEGVFMGGMVARRVEGMGPRMREDTDWGASGTTGGERGGRGFFMGGW